MTRLGLPWQALVALALCIGAAFGLPLFSAEPGMSATATVEIFALIFAAVIFSAGSGFRTMSVILLFAATHAAAWLLISGLAGNEGTARLSYFALLAATWLMAWRTVSILSHLRPVTAQSRTFVRLAIPLLFGVWILILWEAIVRGAGVSAIILPPPSAIAARIVISLPMLAADVNQTIFKSALTGYVIGGAAGFLVAILADRVAFFRRGLLPIGNMMSALPIIGVAPIMVTWFGPDWPSKAGVVVVMTFFPMLVNTVTGLTASGHMERDLMRTYASSYWQTLFKLRLPAAAPFIFNALKINSTLALIGAIVAEFFTTPVVGMGFRISTEIGLLRVDMAWAEIAVAALAGSVFYGVIALIERATTFWHPSVRGG